MKERISKRAEAGPKTAQCVVVIYENTAVREHAVRFCDRVVKESRGATDLEINWWSFAFLSHPASIDDAAEKAREADLVIFALNPGGDLPAEIKFWLEGWIHRRGEREGALVGLVERRPGPDEIASLKEIYLRHTAHRAGMDYLSHMPPTMPVAIPNSIDSFNARAGKITSVLNEILHTPMSAPPVPLL